MVLCVTIMACHCLELVRCESGKMHFLVFKKHVLVVCACLCVSVCV